MTCFACGDKKLGLELADWWPLEHELLKWAQECLPQKPKRETQGLF